MGTRRFSGLGLATAAVALAAARAGFGGENPLGPAPDPANWHHEALARAAARSAGFTTEAENALAFHTDYVDSYLYNPLWWAKSLPATGAHRAAVATASRHDLVKVHFDDLFAPEQVAGTWRRYLSGTVAALLWIASEPAHRPRRAMAHNVIGTSLHAIQDFYTHSNWIDDPCRRHRTWFEVPASERAGFPLWTGSYELPDHLGIKHHGAYQFACTVLNRLGQAGLDVLQSTICHDASPYAGSQFCQWVRDCGDDDLVEYTPPVDIPGGFTLPEDVVFARAGINVDSRWQAEVGAAERDVGLTGPEAFDAAYGLAERSSCQWLRILAGIFDAPPHQGFWEEVRTGGVATDAYDTDIEPWEDLALIPYRFISAGPYPPPAGYDDEAAWYLRLEITTAAEAGAGTDADIVPVVGGDDQPVLDHAAAPGGGTLLDAAVAFNDFERGATAAYYLGPFPDLPEAVSLRNDAPGLLDIAAQVGASLVGAVVDAFEAVFGFLAGLAGVGADRIGDGHVVASPAELAGLEPGESLARTITCAGASEGTYDVRVEIEKTAAVTSGPGFPMRTFAVTFVEVKCVEQSAFEYGNDEPFVLCLAIPHGGGGHPEKHLAGPYDNVATGAVRSIGKTFELTIPEGPGFISAAVAVYESDLESPSDRLELLADFAGQAAADAEETEQSLTVFVGEAVAASWRPARVEAAAFRRGAEAELRRFAAVTADDWVGPGATVEVPLVVAGEPALVAVPDEAAAGCDGTAPPQPVALAAILKEKPWGGDRFTGANGGGARIGESWVVADLPESVSGTPGGDRSVVAGGPLAGRRLRDLMKLWGRALLGDAALTAAGDFPLLVKVIDAAQPLSVQVHPDAAYAARHPGAHPKTESWYVIAAEPGAVLYIGLADGVDERALVAACRSGDVEEVLVAVPARPGTLHHLPAGTVHAIGAGVVVAEVQTPSDTTFRLYDWARQVGRRPRELHVEEALAAIRWDVAVPAPVRIEGSGELMTTDAYVIRQHLVAGEMVLPAAPDVCRILFGIDGAVSLCGLALDAGAAALVPAALAGAALPIRGKGRFLEIAPGTGTQKVPTRAAPSEGRRGGRRSTGR